MTQNINIIHWLEDKGSKRQFLNSSGEPINIYHKFQFVITH